MDEDTDTVVPLDLCKICLKKKSIYTCPRCNLRYCSLDCYRSEAHAECSEFFYQEWVETELKTRTSDPDARKKMMEILKKNLSSECEDADDGVLDSDDEASVADISERLEGVDLDDAEAIWDKLSAEERSAFREVMNSGEAAKLVPVWKPWWTDKYEEPKVHELHSKTNSSNSLYATFCPPVSRNIKPLSCLTKAKPASNIIYNLLNVLGGYALVMRHLNGEYDDFVDLAVALLFDISKSLSMNKDFSSADLALEAVVLQALLLPCMKVTDEDTEQMKSDVRMMVDGPCSSNKTFYILSVLCDLRELFIKTQASKNKSYNSKKSSFSTSFPEEVFPDIERVDRNKCHKCVKRLEYFQSFVLEFKFENFKF